jgi:hypothetical protein
MRFECQFQNPSTGERRHFETMLDARQVAEAKASSNPDLFFKAYGLRDICHRKEFPKGFQPDRSTMRLTPLQ